MFSIIMYPLTVLNCYFPQDSVCTEGLRTCFTTYWQYEG